MNFIALRLRTLALAVVSAVVGAVLLSGCVGTGNFGGGGDGESGLGGVERKPVEIRTFTDDRDGKTYKAVQIGNLWWMAENVNYNVSCWQCNWCYDSRDNFCGKYGRLYNWDAAMQACPSGWHLPTKEEWDDLKLAVGGKAGNNLKAASWGGTDDYGFSALPGGGRWSAANAGTDIYRVGTEGFWWTATEGGRESAYNKEMKNNLSDGHRDKKYAYSVRCVSKQGPASDNRNNVTQAVFPKVGRWKVDGKDSKEWTGNLVIQQADVSSFIGYFEWFYSTSGEYAGKEEFSGEYDTQSKKLRIKGYRLVEPNGIGLGTYEAYFSEDDYSFVSGTWGGGVELGTWSAILQE